MELLYKKEAYEIIGACFEVYNEHRNGFLESVYHESLQYEFGDRRIPAVSEPQLQIRYKGRVLKRTCKPDFVCYGKVIVELKAVSDLGNEHRAQLLNYLKATGFELGLLVNFGKSDHLQWERIARSQKREDLHVNDAPLNLHKP